MNRDAFEGSETVERGGEPRGLPFVAHMNKDLSFSIVAAGDDQVERYQASKTSTEYIAGEEAVDQDMRLKRCGLVWYEDQLTSRRWVARPGIVPGAARLKVLPLFMVKPAAGLEIEATDGEKYILPREFKGDWFSIVSPKNVPLIGE